MNFFSLLALIYDGSTDPQSFRQQFELLSVFHNWDVTKQLTLLPLLLSGKAERAYNAITDKTSIASTLDELVKALAKPQYMLLEDFLQRRRAANESMTHFAFALQKLLIKAMPDLPDAQMLPMLKGRLCPSLPDHIRARILFNSSMAWDEVLWILDKAMPGTQHPDNSYSNDQQYSNNSNNEYQAERKKFHGKCSYCKIWGHKAAACRSRQREQGQQ